MAIKKRLALYFSSDALSAVELEGAKIINHYHVPYDIFSKEEPQPSPTFTEEIRLTAVLQKTLRDQKIEAVDCLTSIANKDIILRSFFIPQMATQEIVGAVEFEVRKYIPFKVDELVYDFQVTKIREGEIRKLRILFVGMRKEILARYLYILEQSNLKAATLEPSPVSLLRILTQKKLVFSNHSCVVIEIDHEQGNIMILDKSVPQFIRDFKLLPTPNNITEGAGEAGEDSSFIRLLNEVRVSLDYYRRQFSHVVFDKIIFCSERDVKGWAENLEKELSIPVSYLKPQDVLNLGDGVDIGLLKAVGVGIKDFVNLPIAINLSGKNVIQETKEARALKQAKALHIKSIMRLALAATALVFLIYLFSSRQVWDLNTKLKNINQRNSKYMGKNSDELRGLIADFNKRISTYKEIKARRSVTPEFSAIGRLLPGGAWMDNLDMQYNEADNSISLSIKGSVYSEESENQINLVNKFLENLKNDAQFSRSFKSIELNFANQGSSGEFRITNFEINCR